jgi:hypothetical protein
MYFSHSSRIWKKVRDGLNFLQKTDIDSERGVEETMRGSAKVPCIHTCIQTYFIHDDRDTF